VATLMMSGGVPAATWVSTLARKSFQSVPLMAEISNLMLESSLVICGCNLFWSSVALACSPKYSILSVFDDEPPLLLPQAARSASAASPSPPAPTFSRVRRAIELPGEWMPVMGLPP
jgi:hypothetical protein